LNNQSDSDTEPEIQQQDFNSIILSKPITLLSLAVFVNELFYVEHAHTISLMFMTNELY
jgi:hypothetical protein